MPLPFWYPSQQSLVTFPSTELFRRTGTNANASDLYPIMSISDRAKELSVEASHELAKASAKAQKEVGGIELYSPKFYAACTSGGLFACVGWPYGWGDWDRQAIC